MQHAPGREQGREQGQSLLEFALISPVLLFMLLGLFDLGYVLFTYAQASFQLREALRYGTLTKEEAEDGTLMPRYRDCERIADLASSVFFADEQVTVQYMNGYNTGLTTVCWENGTMPAAVDTNGDGLVDAGLVSNGDVLQVHSIITIDTLTPILPDTLTFDLAGQRTVYLGTQLTGSPDDTDSDGLTDDWERANLGNLSYNATDDPDLDKCNNGCEELRGTDPLNPDTDGDGLKDGEEAYKYGTPPLIYDWDGEGLSDGEEVNAVYHGFRTNPNDTDTDDDGLTDYDEIFTVCYDADGNPLLVEDEDEEGVFVPYCSSPPPSPLLGDSDGDGVSDGNEVNVYHTDPTGALAPGFLSAPYSLQYGGSNCAAGDPANRYMSLTWSDDSSPVEGYRIWAMKMGGWTHVGTVSGTSCSGPATDANSCFNIDPAFYDPAFPEAITYKVEGFFGTETGPASSPYGPHTCGP